MKRKPKIGDRVTLNKTYLAWNAGWRGRVWKPGVRATVVGFSRKYPPCVNVRADGHPTRECFHPDFLSPL